MNTLSEYPGNPQHQAVLKALVTHYADDPCVLAVALFGSLVRGNWDRYSDLDLDIVIADGVGIHVVDEVERLDTSFSRIDEQIALIVPDGHDAVDIVLSSLLGLSIRYHPLETTSPNIVDSLLVLSGSIDAEMIKAAGWARQQVDDRSTSHLLDACLRYAVEVDHNLHRNRPWQAIEALHRMRSLIMEVFTRTHNGVRSVPTFETQAETELQSRLGATLPQYDLGSIRVGLARFLDILEHDLEALTNGQIQLTAMYREVLHQVRVESAELS
jgi:predicted nucleotidyltransferase